MPLFGAANKVDMLTLRQLFCIKELHWRKDTMDFTDLIFLFIFLPVSFAIYYLASGEKLRQWILLMLSMVFYACGSSDYFFLLLFTLFINITLGFFIEKSNQSHKNLAAFLLILGISMNVGVLGYYKYADFSLKTLNSLLSTQFEMKNLLLPLGISFYTFKAISYLIDVYEKRVEKNSVVVVALYLSFFGQITSGPITRYAAFEKDRDGEIYHQFGTGVNRFLIGFIKKILLANVLSNITTEIFDNTYSLSTSLAWLGAICYSLQLYYDFSGYSDMAIGISGMFGYRCSENFNYPYTTSSVTEFWRKWHITLGAWFRDYIYIPLGGSREGKIKLYRNMLIVWLITGLWHGANWNFIVWGLGYFILIACEKALGIPKCWKHKGIKNAYRVFVLAMVNFEWVMFRCKNVTEGFEYIKSMVVPINDEIASARARFLLQDYAVFIVCAILFAMPIVPKIEEYCKKNKMTEIMYHLMYSVVLIILFTLALSLVISGQSNPFLYGNF